MRNIVLGLVTRGYDKVRDLARQASVSVKETVGLTKEARREFQASIREAKQEAGLLSEAARKRRVSLRAPDEGDGLREAGGAAAAGRRALSRAQRVAGVAGSIGGAATGTLTGALGAAASFAGAVPGLGPIVAATMAVVIPLLNERARQQQIALQDVVARAEAFTRESLRTFGEQLRADPTFAYMAARQASREIAAEEARVGDRGWSESTRGLLGDE